MGGLNDLRDRLQTVVDELCGMEEELPAEELVDRIEQAANDWRIRARQADGRLDRVRAILRQGHQVGRGSARDYIAQALRVIEEADRG